MVNRLAYASRSHAPATSPRASSVATGDIAALRRGEIVVNTRSHGFTGGAVTAQMGVPLCRADLWPLLTDYSRWTRYFPNITRSEELPAREPGVRRLYQVGEKSFFVMAAQVEIYLRVYEQSQRSIRFCLERGTFADFTAELTLQDWHDVTLLSYSVAATPLIPVPGFVIEQGMKRDLPSNMEQMRRVLLAS